MMKLKYPTMEEFDYVDIVAPWSKHGHATKDEVLKPQASFTSFLEKDDSFLTPWSWKPNACKNETNSSTKEKEFLSFQRESYFTYKIIDKKCGNNNAQVTTDNQCSPSPRSCSQAWYPDPLIFVNEAPTDYYLPVSYYYRNRKYKIKEE